MGRMIGYARVSTSDQDVSLQWEALQRAGCQEPQIFCDTASGIHAARPGLEACLRALAPGDMLVVWRLDRLGRSMAHLVTLIEELLQRQVGFRSLSDGAIDTTTASGELVFHLFSALAQFERRLIQERTRAFLVASRRRHTRLVGDWSSDVCSSDFPPDPVPPGRLLTLRRKASRGPGSGG